MKDKITHILSDLTDSVNERIKHPLLFSFLISWLVVNWKIALILFSNKTVNNKILDIQVYLSFNDGFIYPLIFSLFYALVLPFISVYLERFLIKVQNLKIENNFKIESKKIKEELNIVANRLELEDKRSKEKNLESLREELENLKKINEENNQIIKELNQENQILQLEKNKYLSNKDLNLKKEEIPNYMLELLKTYETLKSDGRALKLFNLIHCGEKTYTNHLNGTEFISFKKLENLELAFEDEKGRIITPFQSKHLYNEIDNIEAILNKNITPNPQPKK